MKCNKCGSDLERNARFCTECGAPVPADEIYCDRRSVTEEGNGGKSHSGIMIGIIIGVLILILGGIAFVFRNEIIGLFSGDSSGSGDSGNVHPELSELAEEATSSFTLTDKAVQEPEKAEIKRGNVAVKAEYDNGAPVSASVEVFKEGADESAIAVVELTAGSGTVLLEEGRYFFRLTVDGKEITSPVHEVTFEADANGDIQGLILPAIVIEASQVYPDIVNAAYDSRSVWIEKMTEDYGVTDDFYFWFQDVNMDGKADFVVGPAITGAHACYIFTVWEEKGGRLEKSGRYYNDDYMTNDILMWHNYGEDMDFKRPASNADSFYPALYKSGGNYIYLYPISDGDASVTVMAIRSISCPDGIITEEFRIERSANNDFYYVKGKSVAAEQFREYYESYCSDLTPVSTYTEKLSYNELQTASEKNWKERLNSSYETWKIEDSSGDVNLGFDSYISRMKDKPEPSVSANNDSVLYEKNSRN